MRLPAEELGSVTRLALTSFLLILAVGRLPAHAASFDCARALEPMENLICGNAQQARIRSASTATAHAAQMLSSEDIVSYYSANDLICEPLARALTIMMHRRLGSSDILDAKGNSEILQKAGFTTPEPLRENSYPYLPRYRELYDLDLTEDGPRASDLFCKGLKLCLAVVDRLVRVKAGAVLSADQRKQLSSCAVDCRRHKLRSGIWNLGQPPRAAEAKISKEAMAIYKTNNCEPTANDGSG